MYTFVRNEAMKKYHAGEDFCKHRTKVQQKNKRGHAPENTFQKQDHFLESCHFPQAAIQPTSQLNKFIRCWGRLYRDETKIKICMNKPAQCLRQQVNYSKFPLQCTWFCTPFRLQNA